MNKTILLNTPTIHNIQNPHHTNNTYYIQTFNYQINKHNSKQITKLLNTKKIIKINKTNNTNLIIINTYTIHNNTNQHLYNYLKNLKSTKQHQPKIHITINNYTTQKYHPQTSPHQNKIPKITTHTTQNNTQTTNKKPYPT